MKHSYAMQHKFWLDKWEKREIGFHEGKPNSLLVSHFSSLNLKTGSRVFLPLCGKTRDIAWFLEQGCQVAGAELCEIAVGELFSELTLEPEISGVGHLKHYSASGLDLYVGDIFALSPSTVGPVDAVYDRAALVALPSETRVDYTAHLRELTGEASQLLITFEYDQTRMDGPPFSIPEDEIHRHYGGSHQITLLESRPVEGDLKGQVPARERIHLIGQGFRETH